MVFCHAYFFEVSNLRWHQAGRSSYAFRRIQTCPFEDDANMVLLHGGSPKGTEFIVSRWADHRKVPQVAFRPDWAKHGRSAPFKRNDALLDVLPIGVLVFPGTGIQENLAEVLRTGRLTSWLPT